MQEKLVKVQGEYELAGTMTVPDQTEEGSHPAILILPGTGESDRDGNRGGLDMNLYKDLAAFLTSSGFITLRFDKRGTYESKGNADERGLWDMVEDGMACVCFLKQHPLVDQNRIIILGHSEGTMLGPAVHVREAVAGLILLSGGAMCMRDVVKWQRHQAFEALEKASGFKGWLIRTLNVTEKAEKKNLKFEEKLLNSNKAVMRIAGKKLPAKWMREHYNYDVSVDMAKVNCPVLLVAGSKDVQVPLQAVERAAALAKGETEMHVIPNMTHILKRWDGELDASNPLKVYREQASEPLQEELRELLEKWLRKHFG